MKPVIAKNVQAVFLACISLFAIVPANGAAGDQSAKPGINAEYKRPDLDVDRWDKSFQGESREVFAARHDVLAAIGVKPGQTVADVGAGTGIYSRLFSRAVGPNGTVYAVDIAKPFLELINSHAAAEGIANIKTVLGEDRKTNLPSGAVDIIFTSDVYHHFEYPQAMLADIKSVLKPGGHFIVVDFHRIPGVTSAGRLEHVRAGLETVRAEIEQAGLTFVEEAKIKGFAENYFLRFRK
jgi:ubiquinone/menaquinone biosynthesis C-methylase UbiE